MPSENSRFDIVSHDIYIPSTGIEIAPLGDVHINAPMHAHDVFNDWCRRQRKRQKEHPVYYVGVGDYLETLSTSERKSLVQLHSSSREWLDERISDDVKRFVDKLEFTRGRWLGMLCGNHNHISADGYTITEMIAKRLDAPALGVCAAIRLYCSKHRPGSVQTPSQLLYDIWAHHGVGGGSLIGSTLNSIERWAKGLDCDLVLMGHDHKQASGKFVRMRLGGQRDNLRVRQTETTLVRTGGFLKAYDPGKVSYLAERAAVPVILGAPTIRLYWHAPRNKINSAWRDDAIITEVTT